MPAALSLPAPEDLRDVAALLRDFTRDSLRASDETLDVLSALRGRGIKCGLVSNCSPEVPYVWQESVLSRYLDVYGFSCLVGHAKPAPEIYLHVCRLLGVKPEHCLYLGDGSSRELTAAAELGMRAVLLKSSIADTYDVYRSDLVNWSGGALGAISEVLGLIGSPCDTAG